MKLQLKSTIFGNLNDTIVHGIDIEISRVVKGDDIVMSAVVIYCSIASGILKR